MNQSHSYPTVTAAIAQQEAGLAQYFSAAVARVMVRVAAATTESADPDHQ